MKAILTTLISLTFLLLTPYAVAEVSPMTVDGATTIDTAKAKSLYDDGAIFIDVRSDKDWANGRIPDAAHIELKSVFNEESLSDEVGKDEVAVIYCNGENCLRSSKASMKAVEWGFSQIHYYRDGFPAWKSAGYPVE
ncbi:rhodanese-like domain-containing protein [Vibrio kyushuensis]|uniref:rhodanese-like domain-containing protein n=1 Tax=Vibrio kyushuensis TaxID=2910249 RepID=UPI003D10FA31